ncbi:MAG: hypothetical protein HZC11_02300 [Nitrospirae bacterium]|nr:hypothetical protein [Nitrospirota bacterium]
MKKRIFIILTVFALSIHGCATPGRESFNLGQELAKQNRLEESIAMYEDALKKEPDNPEYLSAIKDAKGSLSARYVQSAKAILDVTPLTYGQARGAYQEADKASRLTPEDSNAVNLKNFIKSEMDRIIKEAETLYSSASKAAAENKWVDAYNTLKEIKKIYPDYLDVHIKLKQVENDGLFYYLKEAEKFKRNDEWGEAIRTLSLAMEITPDNLELQTGLQDAKTRHNPDYYITKAGELSAANEWDKAIGFVQQAYDLNPSDGIKQVVAKIRQQAAAFHIGQFKQSLSEKQLYSAYKNLTTAFKYHPPVRSEKSAADSIHQFIGNVLAKAEAYETKGYFGNAIAWYEKVIEIDPKNKNAFTKIQSLKDGIKGRVAKKIAIMDFTSPSNKPDVGRIVTDNLLSYVTSNAGSDVKVLARDVLGAILKEIEYGQAGIYDIESAKKAGKLKGTDIFIFGSVLNYDVDKNVSEGYQSKNVVVGKKSTPNPTYQFWLMSRGGTAPTEDALKNAPPAMIEEEIRETVKYKVGTEKKIATVAVSFRVVDVEEGEVVITKTIKEQKEVKDDFSEGVAFADVSYDPLEMPIDNELLADVTKKVVEQLGYMVLSRFQNLQILYHTSAEMFKKKMEYEKAVEKYTDGIYVEEIKNISSPLSEDSRNEIEKLLQQIEL